MSLILKQITKLKHVLYVSYVFIVSSHLFSMKIIFCVFSEDRRSIIVRRTVNDFRKLENI